MNTSLEFILVTALFITLMMGNVSYLCYLKYKDRELSNLTEFWVSLAVNEIIFYFLQDRGPQYLAVSMIGWLWPMRTFRLVLQDISGKRYWERWEIGLISVGAFLSLALGSYGYSFLSTSLPLSLVFGGLGLFITARTFREVPRFELTPLMIVTFIFMGLLFFERLAFPLWGINPIIHGLILLGLAITGLSTYLEKMSARYKYKLEEVVKERKEKLLGSSKYAELGMMAAGIAHEINNPLAVIQARTTQLLRLYQDPTKQEDLGEGLKQILYTTERIDRTIQGVREFVHQDENPAFQEVKVKDLIDGVMSFTGQRLKNHGISVRFYSVGEFTVYGNKIQLEQILLNLLNNSFDAIEFLPEKWIELSVAETERGVQIYFKDSGHGIPPEIADKIMDPFFSTKEVGKGTGLGLALAKGIAEKHGGRLEYLAQGNHTTFCLELPRRNVNIEWERTYH